MTSISRIASRRLVQHHLICLFQNRLYSSYLGSEGNNGERNTNGGGGCQIMVIGLKQSHFFQGVESLNKWKTTTWQLKDNPLNLIFRACMFINSLRHGNTACVLGPNMMSSQCFDSGAKLIKRSLHIWIYRKLSFEDWVSHLANIIIY